MTTEEFVSKLNRDFGKIEESDISAFEMEIGVALPGGYRSFLALSNGGRFQGSATYSLPINEYFETLDTDKLTVFFGLNIGRQRFDLRSNLIAYDGRIPNDTIAIAIYADELLLLDVRSDKKGQVLLWVRDDELLRDRHENKILIATSFEAFVAGCQEVAEED